MSGKTLERVSETLFSKLEILEVEAARLMLLAKADSGNSVLATSAALVYETVTATREDILELVKRSKQTCPTVTYDKMQ